MNEPFEEIKYKNHLIKLCFDSNPDSPREWDNLGVMLCFHKRYDLGDKTDYRNDDYNGWDDVAEALKENEKAKVILPLYLYDHSGLRMKVGSFQGYLSQGHAEFDSGQVGFIFAREEDIKKEYGVKKITKKLQEKVTKNLEQEVETYDKYLSGQVVGFMTETKEGEDIDSCWGFYDEEQAIIEAKNSIDYEVEKMRQARQAKTKSLILARVPILYRS